MKQRSRIRTRAKLKKKKKTEDVKERDDDEGGGRGGPFDVINNGNGAMIALVEEMDGSDIR